MSTSGPRRASAYSSGNSPGLFRAALCGGPVEHIGPSPGAATAADDLWIYSADSAGAIHRIAK